MNTIYGNSVTITIRPEGRNIRDLADNYQHEIQLGKRYKYVVVFPAYYKINPMRCETLAAAIGKMVRMQQYDGVRIIDREGRLGSLNHCAGERWIDWDEERDPCVNAWESRYW